MNKYCYSIKFKTVKSDLQGSLSFFESYKEIPFTIKRIYFTYNVPSGSKRGLHAHKNLKQVLWCPYGKIKVVVNDGLENHTFTLNSPDKGLILLKGYWRYLYWIQEDSILCVAASELFSENDYIRDFDSYLKYVKEGGYK
jgi:dTDP-4-dehydrorhamnose 3,5-epimerase-like enzyme